MEEREPTSRQLREFVQRASRGNPHLVSRLEKATFLVLLRHIEPNGEHYYRIGSEDGLRYYTIRNGHCECTDYLRHGSGHPCKHRLAVVMYLRLQEPGSHSTVPDLTLTTTM